jgi:hypothetical protein
MDSLVTFDEWLNEMEGYGGPRRLRLWDDINNPDIEYNTRILDWLYAAYEVGREHERMKLEDDGK